MRLIREREEGPRRALSYRCLRDAQPHDSERTLSTGGRHRRHKDVITGDDVSTDVISGDVISGDVISGDVMLLASERTGRGKL